MADFNSFISQIEDKFEGGYQNLRNDNGNWTGGKVGVGTLVGTNHGIAAPTLSQWLGRTATISDMKNLSKEDAKKIYKSLFWDRINADKIQNQGIAEFIFDWSLGSAYAYKEMNKALNYLYGTNFPTSGVKPIGDEQINVINSASDPNKLLDTLKTYRINWYNNIVKADPTQAQFLPSWTSRTMSMFNKWYGNLAKGIETAAEEGVTEVKKIPKPIIIAGIGVLAIATFFLIKAISTKTK